MGSDSKNPFEAISDITNDVLKKADFGITNSVLNQAGIQTEGVVLDPNAAATEGAKQESRDDAKQRQAAKVKQEQDRKDLIRVKAANAEAGEGSSIILGTNRKNKGKKKGGSVSSGLGLASGSTGLQT